MHSIAHSKALSTHERAFFCLISTSNVLTLRADNAAEPKNERLYMSLVIRIENSQAQADLRAAQAGGRRTYSYLSPHRISLEGLPPALANAQSDAGTPAAATCAPLVVNTTIELTAMQDADANELTRAEAQFVVNAFEALERIRGSRFVPLPCFRLFNPAHYTIHIGNVPRSIAQLQEFATTGHDPGLAQAERRTQRPQATRISTNPPQRRVP